MYTSKCPPSNSPIPVVIFTHASTGPVGGGGGGGPFG